MAEEDGAVCEEALGEEVDCPKAMAEHRTADKRKLLLIQYVDFAPTLARIGSSDRRLLNDAGSFQIGCGFRLCTVADLNIVDHLGSTRRPRHPGRGPFVLHDVGSSFPGHHSTLDMKMKSIFPYLGFGELHSNSRVDLSVGVGHSSGGAGWGSAAAVGRNRVRRQHENKHWQEEKTE